MFLTTRIGVAVIVWLGLTTISNGQTTVWLSDNATFADLDITTAVPLGTAGSFDIWIKTEQPSRHNSIGLALMTMGNAIEFTGADIVIGMNRFQSFQPILSDNGTMITSIAAYAGLGFDLGTGIGPGVPVDDVTLDAYRFATVHYRVAGLGISELQLKVDDFVFGNLASNSLHLGIDDPMTLNIPGGTDTIIDGRIRVVPEPDSLLLLAVGGFFLRR